ncbi:hypothetical protein BBP00_00004344 [Phytophthora kernoviae]|uniref:Uncharacterized protein n=1 Tax=Phytophthora kernoviae TaxID=325452 RepID=A0A3F2RS06_9STRA|nr:hypothetical protein BBP00_00004344 [Phytophthora kernoviae]
MVAAATLVASVNAHGYMSVPKVEFTFVGDTTQFMATIEASATGWSGSFGGSPADNTAAFTTAFESSKYSSLKELVTDLGQLTSTSYTTECGYTNPDETAQPLPETYVEWAHSDSEGFTPSHEGPCEVWCDDVRVFQDDDCAAHYTTAPAKLPYDHDACLGSSRLTLYWLALHSSTWQVYTNCAALESMTSTGATSKYAVGGILTVVASSMLAATVQGHGYMSAPPVEFTLVGDTTQYMGSIDATTSGFSGEFGGAPKDNTANFNKGMAASKYTSLKEFMAAKAKVTSPEFTLECGYTNPKGAAQPLPETYVEWSHGSGEGFTSSHEGPCEVWCDDTRVFQDDNCPANFPTAPAKLPYDREACLGSSVLTLYWIALHSPSWQVYINCAALEKTTSTGAKSKFAVGSSSGGTSSSKPTTPATDASTTQDAEAPATPSAPETPSTPATPSAPKTPSAPATPSAPETPSTPATEAPSAPSTPATEAPTAAEAPAADSPVVTPAPDTGASQTQDDTSKCSVRRRRRN